MGLVYVSKNSWWDARKARKVLLPLAASGLPGVSVLLVNAAQPWWRPGRHPGLWRHPDTGMLVRTPTRLLPLQRFAAVRRWNQAWRWRQIRRQILRQMRQQMGALPAQGSIPIILSDPEDVYLADRIRRAGHPCYFDWTEKWDAYAQAVGKKSQSRTNANEILSHVDGILAVSAQLTREADALGLRCLHLPNAVSDAFLHALQRVGDEPEALKGIPSPRVLHVGSCNPNWIHWDWLLHAARCHPEISFCMLGGGGEGQIAADLPANIHLLGRIPYEQIPAYFQHVQGLMLLYRVEATAAGDPTKLYEYLASGLPVVASPHPRCLEFAPWIHLVDSAAAFSEKLGSMRDEDRAWAQQRIDLARLHTWTVRAAALMRWLES